jgi:hypothetical protein
MDKKISNLFLGSGTLTWNSEERVSDRYGSVHLFNYENQEDTTLLLDFPLIKRLNGSLGNLKASVIGTRQSSHIGDIFRQLQPVTPKINEVIMLGHGHLFYEKQQGILCIGLRPPQAREIDWLNPSALYRCHHQTVELYFQPEKEIR